MKKLCVAAVIAAMALPLPSLAADTPSGATKPNTGSPNATNDRDLMDNQEWKAVTRVSKVIGTNVKNPQGQNMGEIKDVVVDPVRGQIAYAVLSFGGFLGVGTKLHAVPWKALQLSSNRKHYVLAMDKERLKNAPGFDKNRWPDMTTEKWHSDAYKYYDQKPYWQVAP